MEYPKVMMVQFVITFLCFYLPTAYSIIGRDLVLTPKQGLQLNGKSLYYQEESNEALRNLTKTTTTTTAAAARPWERTLKHVTFVTLFTNVAADAAAGNVSKLKEYSEFLQSPYMNQEAENDARFGDIVTLATGRVEESGENGTYRFVEGNCDYKCVPERVWALWQVQRIRHRADNRKFRYEMKFSVSPLRYKTNELQVAANGEVAAANRRKADEGNFRRNQDAHHFIQKDDDYPQSFGRIIYRDENNFAERRKDSKDDETNKTIRGRNFRQVTASEDYGQVGGVVRGERELGYGWQHGELNGEGPWIPSKSFGNQQVEEYPVRGVDEENGETTEESVTIRRAGDEGLERKGNIFTADRPLLPLGNNLRYSQVESATRVGARNFMPKEGFPLTPLAQPTFVHGIFQPHPGLNVLPRPLNLPPGLVSAPNKLNIGEYVKDYAGKSKIELFPNVLNRNAYYPTPTTYRPQYQMKFPRPETLVAAEPAPPSVLLQPYPHNSHFQQEQHPQSQHQHQQQPEELVKFPDNSPEQLMGNEAGKQSPAVVTHHFHHHFYMPPPAANSGENELNSRERPDALQEVTPTYYGSYYNGKTIATHTENMPPAPQKINVGFPQSQPYNSDSKSEDEEAYVGGRDEDYVVQVSPVPTLKRPNYQTYTGSSAIQIVEPNVPLFRQPPSGKQPNVPLFNPPTTERQKESQQTNSRSKQQPFVQSESLDDDDNIRYSEPDPLYMNQNNQFTHELVARNESKATKGTPYQRGFYVGKIQFDDEQQQQEKPKSAAEKEHRQHKQPAQVHENPDESNEETEPTQRVEGHNDQEHNFSFKNLKISTNQKFKASKRTTPRTQHQTKTTTTPSTLTAIESTTATITSTATTTSTPSIANQSQAEPQADPQENTEKFTTTPSSNDMAATLATTTIPSESTLPRTHTRRRLNSSNSSTTPAPVLKWKPRRKGGAYGNGKNGLLRRQADSKAKGSIKHIQRAVPDNISTTSTTTTSTTTTSTTSTTSSPEALASATLATTITPTAETTTLPATNSKEIIEVLTQKSVSKSVSIKVGENGEEIPILIEDEDDEKGNRL